MYLENFTSSIKLSILIFSINNTSNGSSLFPSNGKYFFIFVL